MTLRRPTESINNWDTSCPDWERRILNGESLVPDLPLFRDEATAALNIFKELRLPDVIGTPTIGEAGAQWIYPIVEALFGSYDAKTNRRLLQEIFILVPKKNGKSTYAAAIMVTAIVRNRRPDAEFIFLAPSIEVAQNSFRQARGICKLHPYLSAHMHIQDNFRRITHAKTGAYLQIKAMDLDIVTGMKPLGTLIDETHVMADKAKAADIFVEIRGALAARPDGFLLQISTQSKTVPAGVFKAELQQARDVRDGTLKLPKPLLPVLYELPNKIADQWENEKYWPLLNPNLRRSVDPDFLRTGIIKARRGGMGDLALFTSQHFNLQIGQALRGDRWAGSEFWQKQTDKTLTLERLLERSEIVVVGVDGGGLDDLFGLCTLGRCRETKHWLVWSHAWCHEGVLQRRQTIAATLQDFQASGELTIVHDELDDLTEIVDIIGDIKKQNKLAMVAVDPWGIAALVDELGKIDISAERKNLIGVRQGQAMMNAVKGTERKVANGTLWHGGSGLMNWCVSNLKVEQLATGIRLTKQNIGDAKVDAAMAMFDAAMVMVDSPPAAPTYDVFFVG